MGLVHVCPYYQSDKRRTISCEERIRWFATAEDKELYIRRHCCDNWGGCDYAASLNRAYNDGDSERCVDKAIITGNQKEVKRLLQRVGMLEHDLKSKSERILQMEKVSEANHITYERERQRFQRSRKGSEAAIETLEKCIGFLLHQLDTDRIVMSQYQNFIDNYEVTYTMTDDLEEAIYTIVEKEGGKHGVEGLAGQVQGSGRKGKGEK